MSALLRQEAASIGMWSLVARQILLQEDNACRKVSSSTPKLARNGCRAQSRGREPGQGGLSLRLLLRATVAVGIALPKVSRRTAVDSCTYQQGPCPLFPNFWHVFISVSSSVMSCTLSVKDGLTMDLERRPDSVEVDALTVLNCALQVPRPVP